MKKILGIIVVIGIILAISAAIYQRNIVKQEPFKLADIRQEEQNTIVIKDYTFSPASLRVKKGTKVTWINQDQTNHTITADKIKDNNPNSDYFAQGKSYSFTFNTPGTFEYHCEPHPYMKGVVEVTDEENIQIVSLLVDKATPDVVTVKVGEYVQFNSKDGKNHHLSPGSGNAYKEIHEHSEVGLESGVFGPDEGYKVQFHKVGTYEFHDHTNPNIFITVIVYRTKSSI